MVTIIFFWFKAYSSWDSETPVVNEADGNQKFQNPARPKLVLLTRSYHAGGARRRGEYLRHHDYGLIEGIIAQVASNPNYVPMTS